MAHPRPLQCGMADCKSSGMSIEMNNKSNESRLRNTDGIKDLQKSCNMPPLPSDFMVCGRFAQIFNVFIL
jgi:hypothetical protein